MQDHKATFARVEDAILGGMESASPMTDDDLPYDPDKGGNRLRDRRLISTGNAMLDRIITGAGIRVQYGTNMPGTSVASEIDRGDPVPNDPKVTWLEMPNRAAFKSAEAYREIMAHEVVHWAKVLTGAPLVAADGWERMLGIVPEGYPQEELTAEIGAGLLLAAVGEDPGIERRSDYAANWAGALAPHERPKATAAATAEAERRVTELLKFAELYGVESSE